MPARLRRPRGRVAFAGMMQGAWCGGSELAQEEQEIYAIDTSDPGTLTDYYQP